MVELSRLLRIWCVFLPVCASCLTVTTNTRKKNSFSLRVFQRLFTEVPVLGDGNCMFHSLFGSLSAAKPEGAAGSGPFPDRPLERYWKGVEDGFSLRRIMGEELGEMMGACNSRVGESGESSDSCPSSFSNLLKELRNVIGADLDSRAPNSVEEMQENLVKDFTSEKCREENWGGEPDLLLFRELLGRRVAACVWQNEFKSMRTAHCGPYEGLREFKVEPEQVTVLHLLYRINHYNWLQVMDVEGVQKRVLRGKMRDADYFLEKDDVLEKDDEDWEEENNFFEEEQQREQFQAGRRRGWQDVGTALIVFGLCIWIWIKIKEINESEEEETSESSTQSSDAECKRIGVKNTM